MFVLCWSRLYRWQRWNMGFVYVQGSLVTGHRWVFNSPKQPVTLMKVWSVAFPVLGFCGLNDCLFARIFLILENGDLSPYSFSFLWSELLISCWVFPQSPFICVPCQGLNPATAPCLLHRTRHKSLCGEMGMWLKFTWKQLDFTVFLCVSEKHVTFRGWYSRCADVSSRVCT